MPALLALATMYLCSGRFAHFEPGLLQLKFVECTTESGEGLASASHRFYLFPRLKARARSRHVRTKIHTILAMLFAVIAANVFSSILHADDKIKEGFATTTVGVRIHYLQSGDVSYSRALILIPGWRLPAYLWNEQLAKFAQTNHVVAIDPRSQGESTRTTEGNTATSHARDLHEVLAQLKIFNSVLVGWSQGAQDVSAYLQQLGTDSIAGIVLVDSPVSYGSAEVDIHKEFSKAILSTSPSTRIIRKNFPKVWCNRCSRCRIPIWTCRRS